MSMKTAVSPRYKVNAQLFYMPERAPVMLQCLGMFGDDLNSTRLFLGVLGVCVSVDGAYYPDRMDGVNYSRLGTCGWEVWAWGRNSESPLSGGVHRWFFLDRVNLETGDVYQR